MQLFSIIFASLLSLSSMATAQYSAGCGAALPLNSTNNLGSNPTQRHSLDQAQALKIINAAAAQVIAIGCALHFQF